MKDRLQLAVGWEMCATAPGLYSDPHALADADLRWILTRVPATAASSLRGAGCWSLDESPRRFDATDWWYRTTLPLAQSQLTEHAVLGFDGLATVADVWLNGRHILASDNMFLAHECEIGPWLGTSNELHICFRALDELLKAKRARPRWRAPMIENQQLRWFRTTLLGRTPGWSPPCAPVGPWRGVWLQLGRARVSDTRLHAALFDGVGIVNVDCRIATDVSAGRALEVTISGCGTLASAALRPSGGDRHTGEMKVLEPQLWWPHTHGEPTLYKVTLRATEAGAAPMEWPLGTVGFRTVEVDTSEGNFAIKVNSVPIFCRGACWTPLDPVTLDATASAYDQALAQVKDAGMNMLRVGGTMFYEGEDFYQRCDELGILLWQDFMFANMDFPEDDPDFARSVTQEAEQILQRLRRRPCLTVLCGNSEVEQQAAMWGAPRSRWAPELFHRRLRQLAAEHCPHVPYWPSSAHGGAFPHDGSAGTTSYYGVGAYLRPLEDARRTDVRFATECLGFANIPEPETLRQMPGGAALRVHHPAWKARVPREVGPGWDFEDVRDHYLRSLFDVEPQTLRYSDHERYLALGRATTAAAMAAVAGEWRRLHSRCNGALLWFLRDLWAGAGWGIIGADGVPKSAYYALRRVWQPVNVSISDEGTNGLHIHVANERAGTLEASLTMYVYRHGEQLVGQGAANLRLAPRETRQIVAGELLDDFHDLSYAYRFGPPSHDLVHVTLCSQDGALLAESFHLPQGLAALGNHELGLQATVQLKGDSREVRVSTRRYAHSVTVDANGYHCSDQYFSLSPGSDRVLRLEPAALDTHAPVRGQVQALNGAAPVPILFPA